MLIGDGTIDLESLGEFGPALRRALEGFRSEDRGDVVIRFRSEWRYYVHAVVQLDPMDGGVAIVTNFEEGEVMTQRIGLKGSEA